MSKIPETETKTADFHVTKGAETYLVEVTGRGDSGQFDHELARVGEALEHRIHKYDGATQSMLRNKHKQIRATPVDGFGVLWVEVQGRFAASVAAEVKATFLGQVGILVRSPDGNIEKPCYYFDNAECFRRPAINAVVVLEGKHLQVLFNEHAPDAAEFRRSSLVTAFADGLICPREEAANDEAMLLDDFEGDRSRDVADRQRRALLVKKHGLVIPMALRWNSVTTARRFSLPD